MYFLSLLANHGLRILFILLMLTTSIGKLLDNRGFAEVIATYQFGIPESILLPFGLSISLFELVIGLLLIVGYRLIAMAWVLVWIHVGYTALAVTSLLRGLELSNCGCFGVFWARPLTWQTVIEDIILVALSLTYLIYLKKKNSGKIFT